MINSKVLFYSMGNYIQFPWLDHDGKEYKKDVYVCMYIYCEKLYVYVYIYVYMCVYMYVYMCIYICVYVYVYMYVCIPYGIYSTFISVRSVVTFPTLISDSI